MARPQAAAAAGEGRGPVRDWPEFNVAIGGMFLAHPFQHVWVKVDDPKSPITAAFKGQTFEMTDETYTMQKDVIRVQNLRVLLSVDVSKMTPDEAARENRPWDHDYALSWIRREGKGRVFYSAHGHNEAVYGDDADARALPRGHPVRDRRPEGGRQPEREGRHQVGVARANDRTPSRILESGSDSAIHDE